MRKKIMAVVVAVLAFSLIAASAATLGGINTDPGVGADTAVVNAACDTDGVDAAFGTTWDATQNRFEVSEVVISDIADACVGQTLVVALTQGAADYVSSPVVVSGPSHTLGLPTEIDARSNFRVNVSISG